MSFDGRIKLEDIEVYFDYAYDNKKAGLVVENWTAYNHYGVEIQIPDAELSQEIEEELQKFLERKNNDLGTDYRG